MLFNRINAQTDRYFMNHKKNQPSNVHEQNQTVCQKWKGTENPNTGSEDIKWRYKDGIWHKKCAMLIMKSGKGQIMKWIELPNQEKIKTFG